MHLCAPHFNVAAGNNGTYVNILYCHLLIICFECNHCHLDYFTYSLVYCEVHTGGQ